MGGSAAPGRMMDYLVRAMSPVRWVAPMRFGRGYGPLFIAHLGFASACTAQIWPESQIIAPAEVTPGGRFGAALSMEGDWLLVGAPGADDGAPGSGAAYLYNRYEGGQDAWGLVKRFDPPTISLGAGFGSSVLLKDGRAYIACPAEPVLSPSVGAVHVFEQDLGGSGLWGFHQAITPDSTQFGLGFGTSFTVDGTTLIVNAPGYDEAPTDGVPGLGAVIGSARDSASTWQTSRFVRGDALVNEVQDPPCVDGWMGIYEGRLIHAGYFGAFSVPVLPFSDADLPLGTLEELPLPVGAGIPNVPVFFARGASEPAHLLLGIRNFSAKAPRLVSYVADGQGGLQQDGVIHPPDTIASISWWHWGDAIDMDDPMVVVGAFGDETFTPLGHADVYRRAPGAAFGWEHRAALIPSIANTGDQFGRSVAVAGPVVAVGAPGFGTDDRGRVFLFRDPTTGLSPMPSAVDIDLRVAPDPVQRGVSTLRVLGADLPETGMLRIMSDDGRLVSEQRWQGSAPIVLPPRDVGTYVLAISTLDGRIPARTARFTVLP